jgi:hypothetical protein
MHKSLATSERTLSNPLYFGFEHFRYLNPHKFRVSALLHHIGAMTLETQPMNLQKPHLKEPFLNLETSAHPQEIAQIAPVHNIGAMSLETQPMKYSLKAEAASWKAQFAKNLHRQGFEDLKAINNYMRETTIKLARQVQDLEDVRAVMGVLKEVRDREAEIDAIMTPIEEMYALLMR